MTITYSPWLEGHIYHVPNSDLGDSHVIPAHYEINLFVDGESCFGGREIECFPTLEQARKTLDDIALYYM